MKKSLSLCVNKTERKEEKNKSSLCLGVGSLCCFDSTPSRIFLLSLSAYSRQEALPTTKPGWRATLAVSRRNYIQSPLCKFHFPPRRVGIFAETCVKTLLLMHRLHGRALFYLPHLLVECSCGSGELEICGGQKWAAQMYLMRLELTTRGLNYGEIKVLINPKWATKKKKAARADRNFPPQCPNLSVVLGAVFRNKHARSDCLRFLSRTCRKQRGKHHKDFDNPVWDGKLNQQQFLMQFLTRLYGAPSRRSKPAPDLNWVTVPVNAALYISLLIRCK